jgi:hypothetical protein
MGTYTSCRLIYKGKCFYYYNNIKGDPYNFIIKFLDNIKSLIEKYGMEQFITKVKALKLVSSKDIPTEEDKIVLAPYTKLKFATLNDTNWECLMYKCERNIESIIELGYGFDESHFRDCVDCDYIFDIDTLTVGESYETPEERTSITELDKEFERIKTKG